MNVRRLASILGILLAIATPARAGLNADEEFLQLKNWIVENYAEIVHTTYADSLDGARALRAALEVLASTPTAETLEAARQAWIAARAPYLQSESFRFYQGPIDGDAGPEGLLNAWPMDEAYLEAILDDAAAFPDLTPALIAELNEQGGETNIASGYHALEFLLWGRDSYVDSPGRRPVSDFTGRHNAYLFAAADLLVENLESLVAEWAPASEGNYRASFVADHPNPSLEKMLTGISVLSGFELAGERLLVAYDTRLQEDEHSCFSDTTHLDALYDVVGIHNVYTGTYVSPDGSRRIAGPSLKNLAETVDPDLEHELDDAMDRALAAVRAIPPPFDQAVLGDDSAAGRVAILAAVDSLEDLAALFEKFLTTLDFTLPDTGDIEG